MSRNRLQLICVLFAFTLLVAFCNDLRPEQPGGIADDTARFLAGMRIAESSPLYAKTQNDDWREHNREMDAAFAQFKTVYAESMREWSNKTIPEQPRVLFYPFGGPDQLIPQIIFHKSTEYILFGMEPVGSLADVNALNPAQLRDTYSIIRRALSWFLTYTYFQTYQMDRWLRGNNAGGAASVLMVFLARNDSRITLVVPVRIDSNGNLECLAREIPDPDQCKPVGNFSGTIPGVRIYFSKDNIPRTVTYFSINANDDSLARQPQFLRYIRSRGERATFMKAASYLLYGSNFNIVKDFIARESEIILTDDAGLPHSVMDRKEMHLEYFGSYIEPMPMYRNLKQPELQKVFEHARDLPFEIGYTASWKRGYSSLILARKKK
ncbi:MAG: hypothetical protein K8S54_11485 [Spirochaetia bacterium]|nr:hypothetical protein [Spirochaetia bacterium]